MDDTPRYPQVTAAVLAGGQATRLGGEEKALVEVEGATLLSRVLDRIRPLFKETLVVTPRREAVAEAADGCRLVTDNYQGAGPLGGIHAALMAATTPHVFVCGCDMPLLSTEVLDKILSQAGEADIVLARLDDRDQTLHAVYSRDLVMEAGRLLRDGDASPRDLQARHRVVRLGSEAFEGIPDWRHSFLSVNTPEDVESVAAILQEQQG